MNVTDPPWLQPAGRFVQYPATRTSTQIWDSDTVLFAGPKLEARSAEFRLSSGLVFNWRWWPNFPDNAKGLMNLKAVTEHSRRSKKTTTPSMMSFKNIYVADCMFLLNSCKLKKMHVFVLVSIEALLYPEMYILSLPVVSWFGSN